MLVLNRRENESIKIGDDITVTVLYVGERCSIGIEAPAEVTILRSELRRTDDPQIDMSREQRT